MRYLTANRCTRLVGVALLLTAGFSAGVRHAHPGGVGPHDHHRDGSILSEASAQSPDGESAWFSSALHMHIFLLGFQFTLPAEETTDDEGEQSANQVVLVRFLGDNLNDSAARLAAPDCQTVLALQPCDISAVGSAPPLCRMTRLRSLPLCDSARHERSGVQRT